jgi:hypothetical protein
VRCSLSADKALYDVGVCLPKNCSDDALERSDSVKLFLLVTLNIFSAPGLNFSIACDKRQDGVPWSASSITMLVATSIVGALLVVGTAVQCLDAAGMCECRLPVHVRRRRLSLNSELEGGDDKSVALLHMSEDRSGADERGGDSGGDSGGDIAKRPSLAQRMGWSAHGSDDHSALHHDHAAEVHALPSHHPHDGVAWQLIKAWDVAHNANRMVATSRDHGETSALNGLRIVSMMHIVLGHVLYFMQYTGVSNPQALAPPSGEMATWHFQVPCVCACIAMQSAHPFATRHSCDHCSV